jgi:hypothetical protein
MTPAIIISFFLGLIFGGILTAAVSINELNRLRKMLSADKEKKAEVLEKSAVMKKIANPEGNY